MIEIIQRGKDKKHIVTCDNCDTDFSYTQDDVDTKAKIVANCLHVIESTVRCPCCYNKVVVKREIE